MHLTSIFISNFSIKRAVRHSQLVAYLKYERSEEHSIKVNVDFKVLSIFISANGAAVRIPTSSPTLAFKNTRCEIFRDTNGASKCF